MTFRIKPLLAAALVLVLALVLIIAVYGKLEEKHRDSGPRERSRLLAAGLSLIPYIGTEFLPPSDEGEVRVSGSLAASTLITLFLIPPVCKLFFRDKAGDDRVRYELQTPYRHGTR